MGSLGGWVIVSRQKPYSLAERDDAGQVQVCLPADGLNALDGKRAGDAAAAGVQGSEPARVDLCQQGTDVKDEGELEPDGSHAVAVDQDADVGLLGRGDAVAG